MESSSSDMLQTIDQLHSDTAISLFLFSMGVLLAVVLVTTIISRLIFVMHKNRLEAGLKQSLIDQGFSADEISKIVEATSEGKNRNRA